MPQEQAGAATPPGRIRVGGNVQAASLVNMVKPAYPPRARLARISGVVCLAATIGRDGAISNLSVVFGHALLIDAALQAVRQWRYRPTILNGEPVEVETTIDVNFKLEELPLMSLVAAAEKGDLASVRAQLKGGADVRGGTTMAIQR